MVPRIRLSKAHWQGGFDDENVNVYQPAQMDSAFMHALPQSMVVHTGRSGINFRFASFLQLAAPNQRALPKPPQRSP